MNKKGYDTRLMVKCSQMYYEEHLNQGEIAEKLQISKSSVSRILSAAKKAKIIKITVNNPIKNQYIQLEKELEKRFDLKEVIVVDSMADEPEEIKKELAKASAEYLERIIKDGQTIGVTWGTTLNKIKNYINNDKKRDITFLPLVGGIGETNINIHPNSIALGLARKFKGDCKLLHAPSIVDDPVRKDMLIEDKNIQSLFKLMKDVDISLMGIGYPLLNTSTLLESGYFTMKYIKKLEELGAIADISSLFIDKYGKGDNFELNRRVIGIDLEDIKKIPLKIGIAGYVAKKRAILAALVGGYIDVLITDENTAEAILALSDK